MKATTCLLVATMVAPVMSFVPSSTRATTLAPLQRSFKRRRPASFELQAAIDTPIESLDLFTAAQRDDAGKIQLKGLSIEQLQKLVVSLGERPERASELYRWMYGDGHLLDNEGKGLATKQLKQSFLTALTTVATIDGGLSLQSVHHSQDGTRKLLLTLTTGAAKGNVVETVIIPMLQGPQQQPRNTLCVSSQVGCRQNCQFCMTGRMGLLANLQTAQIVEQVVAAKRYLESVNDSRPITGIVFMGEGEAFDNYDSAIAAVHIMTQSTAPGLRLSANRVTVSTAGLVPRIRQYLEDESIRTCLAVSVHATTDTIRDWIVPLNRKYPLQLLMETLEEFFPRDGKRLVSLQYTLLKGVNDSYESAVQLAAMAKRLRCIVNLINFNTHEGTQFERCDTDQVLAFRKVITESGTLCTMRDSRGDDTGSACGQLGSLESVRLAGKKPVEARKPKSLAL